MMPASFISQEDGPAKKGFSGSRSEILTFKAVDSFWSVAILTFFTPRSIWPM